MAQNKKGRKAKSRRGTRKDTSSGGRMKGGEERGMSESR